MFLVSKGLLNNFLSIVCKVLDRVLLDRRLIILKRMVVDKTLFEQATNSL